MEEISRQNEKYILMWADKTSLLTIDFFSQSFICYTQFPWNRVNDSIIYLNEGKELNGYISLRDYSRLKEAHSSYFLNTSRANEVIKKYKELERSFFAFEKKMNSYDFNTCSRGALLTFFEMYVQFLLEVCAWFRATRPEGEIKIVEVLNKRIHSKAKKKYARKVLEILTQSPNLDILKREEKDWLNIAKQKGISDNKLLRHAKKYSILFQNIYDYNLTLLFLRDRLQNTRKFLQQQQKEFDNLTRQLSKLKIKQEGIFKKYNDPIIKKYSKMLQKFGYYRLQLKAIWSSGEFLCLPMFNRIAGFAGITADELVNTYSINDILNLLRNSTRISMQKAKKRKRCVVYIVKNKKSKILEGDIALNFIKNNIKTEEDLGKELTGTTASAGVYTGRARIILSADIINMNIKKGEVLVTDMTQPSMVLIMKKAGAIITNQGGLTSHAAVMSREFKIPCVVGCQYATKKIKNGDLLEVNASKGIIKIKR